MRLKHLRARWICELFKQFLRVAGPRSGKATEWNEIKVEARTLPAATLIQIKPSASTGAILKMTSH